MPPWTMPARGRVRASHAESYDNELRSPVDAEGTGVAHAPRQGHHMNKLMAQSTHDTLSTVDRAKRLNHDEA